MQTALCGTSSFVTKLICKDENLTKTLRVGSGGVVISLRKLRNFAVTLKIANPVSAYPSAGLNIPFYILGSSTESAYLAAELGLPYAFCFTLCATHDGNGGGDLSQKLQTIDLSC